MSSLTDLYSDSFPVDKSAGDSAQINGGASILQLRSSQSPPPSQPEQPRIPPSEVRLTFAQLHGKPPDEEVSDCEVLTSLQFNNSGDLIAVGDRGGRIAVYKRDSEKHYKTVNFQPYIEFQSHDPEFDYLKSIEIEEKIVQAKWVPRDSSSSHLLASNDKTVKLWRIGERNTWTSSSSNLTLKSNSNVTRLALPKIVHTGAERLATLRKCYSNAHSYHINNISVNSDQETFISSDDLRINLWNLEVTDQSFVVVDIKPENMEALQEVITTCTFHPSRCNLFVYSTTKAVTRLCDMRMSALCDRQAKLFRDDDGIGGYFSEIVASVVDAQFSNSGRYLVTRDFLTVKIWDTLMESKPLQTIPVQGYLKGHLSALYENDSLFDKFTVSWSGNDTKIVTGSYDNLFSITERALCKSSLFQVPKEAGTTGCARVPFLKPKRVVDPPLGALLAATTTTGTNNNNTPPANNKGKGGKEQEIVLTDLDFNRKMLACQWSPTENVMAIAGNNSLYIFQEKRGLYL